MDIDSNATADDPMTMKMKTKMRMVTTTGTTDGQGVGVRHRLVGRRRISPALIPHLLPHLALKLMPTNPIWARMDQELGLEIDVQHTLAVSGAVLKAINLKSLAEV